jgi:hypothetical protein
MVLGLASAVLTKVFGRLWHYVVEELHLDATHGFTAQGDVEKDDRVRCCLCCHDFETELEITKWLQS